MIEFLTAVDEATAPAVVRRYPMGSVPVQPQYPYLVYSVSPDRDETYTLDGDSVPFYRVVFQSFGRTLTSALDIDSKATDALRNRVLDVDGHDCGPCRREIGSAVIRDPDASGVVGVTTTLTFTATSA